MTNYFNSNEFLNKQHVYHHIWINHRRLILHLLNAWHGTLQNKHNKYHSKFHGKPYCLLHSSVEDSTYLQLVYTNNLPSNLFNNFKER